MNRILHVVTLVDDDMSYGGPVTVAINQCQEMRRRGLDARLVAGWRGSGRRPEMLDGVPLHLFPVVNALPGSRFYGLVSPGMIRWLLREVGPGDVAHVHLARDLVPLMAAVVLRRLGTPYLTQTHGMIQVDRRPRVRLLDAALTRRVLDGARVRLVLTRQEQNWLDAVLDGTAGQLLRLGNGVRLPAADPTRRDHSAPPEVLFLSRLHPRKRVLDFGRAALQLLAEGSPARFSVVGPDDGDLTPLRALMAEAGHPPGLRYDGALGHEAALSRLSAAGVYVLPSVDEPFGVSLLEAMAAGTPSICTTGCALAAELAEASMAMVVPPGPGPLADALRRLIGDAQLRVRLGEAGSVGVRERFSIEAVGDALEKIYGEVGGAGAVAGSGPDQFRSGPAVVARTAPDSERGSPGSRSAGMFVTSYDRETVSSLLGEWRALHARTGSWGPFADPDLQLAWCRMFVRPGAEQIVTVRHAGSGELVAVIPLFAPLTGLAGRAVRYLRPFGGHHEALINEMPEISLDPRHARAALAAAVSWLSERDDWDFVELSLRGDQHWVEARWLVDAGLDSAVVVHKKAYPSIVLELPDHGQPPFKRNLRESLRRSRNRMKASPGEWRTSRVDPGEQGWPEALSDLVRLHGARSRMDGRFPRHPDVFAGTSQEEYIRVVARTGSTRPVIYRLEYDGATAAALLVFHYPGRAWISVSGIDPAHWRIGAITALQATAVQDAVDAGRQAVVFSVGIDTAKLRWSETVRVRNGFILAHSRRRSRWVFRLYWLYWAHQTALVDVGPYASDANRRRRLDRAG